MPAALSQIFSRRRHGRFSLFCDAVHAVMFFCSWHIRLVPELHVAGGSAQASDEVKDRKPRNNVVGNPPWQIDTTTAVPPPFKLSTWLEVSVASNPDHANSHPRTPCTTREVGRLRLGWAMIFVATGTRGGASGRACPAAVRRRSSGQGVLCPRWCVATDTGGQLYHRCCDVLLPNSTLRQCRGQCRPVQPLPTSG